MVTKSYNGILPLLALIVAFAVSIAMITYATNGVRGTDQYWYLADVSTLSAGNPPTTNLYYPGQLLRQSETSELPNYFLHNGPMLALSSVLTAYLTPHKAWTLVNIVSHVLVALSILLVSLKYTTKPVSYLATALYLLSPTAVWQTINMLQEQFFSGIAALCLLGFVFRKNKLLQLVLIVSLCTGILSHPFFWYLAIFYMLFLLWQVCLRPNVKNLIFTGSVIALFIGIRTVKPHLFPSSFQPNLAAIIAGAVPGDTNMLWHYSNVVPDIDFNLLLAKTVFAIKKHLLDLKQAPSYFYTNIAILCALYLVFTRLKALKEVLIPCIAALSLYLGIITLMQIQPRYQQIIAPASFVIIALSLQGITRKIPQTLVGIGLCGLMLLSGAASAYLANRAHNDAINEKAILQQLSETFENIPTDSRVLLLNSEHELKLNYILDPRKVMAVRSRYLDKQSYDNAIDIFSPNYFVSTTPPGDDVSVEKINKLTIANFSTLYYGELKAQ